MLDYTVSVDRMVLVKSTESKVLCEQVLLYDPVPN